MVYQSKLDKVIFRYLKVAKRESAIREGAISVIRHINIIVSNINKYYSGLHKNSQLSKEMINVMPATIRALELHSALLLEKVATEESVVKSIISSVHNELSMYIISPDKLTITRLNELDIDDYLGISARLSRLDYDVKMTKKLMHNEILCILPAYFYIRNHGKILGMLADIVKLSSPSFGLKSHTGKN